MDNMDLIPLDMEIIIWESPHLMTPEGIWNVNEQSLP